MRLVNQYIAVAFVTVFITAQSMYASVPAAVIGWAGKICVPFCIGMARGVEAYHRDQKFRLFKLIKENALVGVVLTNAFIMENVPACQELHSLAYKTQVIYYKDANNKGVYNITCSHGGNLYSSNFDSMALVHQTLKGLQDRSKLRLKTFFSNCKERYIVHFSAFPAGYIIGYNIAKFYHKKNKAAKA